MARIALDDGTWFETKKASLYEEDTYWDGHNRVSINAGRHSHQELYRTAKGKWVLHCWTQWEGCRDTYEVIDEKRAHTWLIKNSFSNEVPPEVLEEREI